MGHFRDPFWANSEPVLGLVLGPVLDPFWDPFLEPFWIHSGSGLDPFWDPLGIISYGKPTRDEEPDRDDDLVNLLATKNLIAININLIAIKIRGT